MERWVLFWHFCCCDFYIWKVEGRRLVVRPKKTLLILTLWMCILISQLTVGQYTFIMLPYHILNYFFTQLEEKEAKRFFQQIISGVEYCHRHLVVHRFVIKLKIKKCYWTILRSLRETQLKSLIELVEFAADRNGKS